MAINKITMSEERHLIPYHTLTSLPGKNWLVFAPHADDETFGMGGTLLLAQQQSIAVSLVVMTNGILGIAHEKKQLAADIRRQEAKQAAQLLGIKNITFVDEEDRALAFNEPTLEKVRDIIQQQKPDCIFVPAPLELHPDHRMTTLIVWQALQDITLKSDLYGYEISAQGPVNALVDISSVAAQKQQVMQIYSSQIQQNNYIEIVQALDTARTYTLASEIKYAEGFVKLVMTDQACPVEQARDLLANYLPFSRQTKRPLIQELEQQISQLEASQQLLLESTSWKITQPLRWLKRWLL